jgi:hypothetical protein
MKVRTILKGVVLGGAAALLLAQLVRPDLTNPPEDPARTLYAKMKVPDDVKAMIERSCVDCHTNRTRWPWYTHVSPVSWFMASHIREGRDAMSFSEWSEDPRAAALHLSEMSDKVLEKEMPLPSYLLGHPEARLTDAQRERLAGWAASEAARINEELRKPAEPAAPTEPPSAEPKAPASPEKE